MHAPIDIWNPTNWPLLTAAHEFRIYGNNDASLWAVVDEIDYHWAIQWLWCPIIYRHRNNRLYLRRNSEIKPLGKVTWYLHVEIMKRVSPAPSPRHTVVDHRNNNPLDNRRKNLRWATHRLNAYNNGGRCPHDLENDEAV